MPIEKKKRKKKVIKKNYICKTDSLTLPFFNVCACIFIPLVKKTKPLLCLALNKVYFICGLTVGSEA